MSWSVNGPDLTPEKMGAVVAGKKLPLLIYPHQGMGDHIICNGMYRFLADIYTVTVCVRDDGHTFRNVAHMLSDRKDITVIGFKGDSDIERFIVNHTNCVVLRLGYQSPPFDRWQFDQEFYRQAGVFFVHRWLDFKVPELRQFPIPKEPYIFVHDKPGRELKLVLDKPIVRPQGDWCIFSYRDVIGNADEIHCISSSFAALADSYNLTGRKLYFYAQGVEIPKHKNDWTYVD